MYRTWKLKLGNRIYTMIQKLKENKRFIALLILFVLVFWFVEVISTIQHEATHQEICRQFDQENRTIYSNYTFGYMSGETFCSGTPTKEETKLHAQVEIVGYHTTALIYTLFGGVFLLVVYWELG